ncbi:capsule assembly Wzi family protein [Geobacter sp. DSM 9736]|uniref:capsule assembly Wzi family protein n=1 Tax=Geobacter sp. DSM 9736 TaxID=1277350 RepID=UPI000B4FE018|nr:capsule assembly Wzi family protein [Geobacter sp. DSM 9736]SNB45070.1 Capsule assembly protein Wzi [Geobacter sp. DSM 9736]
MICNKRTSLVAVLALAFFFSFAETSWGLASNNIPLDSPMYFYLEKLAGFGLIRDDITGLRPYSRAEAARLVIEAERTMEENGGGRDRVAESILSELRILLAREISLYREPDKAPRFDFNPLSGYRVRNVYLDGASRSYERPVHDPGGDGVFGIGSGLRPDNRYPSLVQQHGTEGTPLLENNEGIRYVDGHNIEIRVAGEAYAGHYVAGLLEPLLVSSRRTDDTRLFLNKAYLKLGGGGLEIEVGRDANWFGLGYRGAITLTNNARNFDHVKLSSPEPISLRYIGDIKYAFILSRFDQSSAGGVERRPYFLGAKLSVKPTENLELGLNLGRQAGGPGVNNGLGETVRGLVGGTNSDNTNSIAGLEARYRIPLLRNTEVYGEFSGEDSAFFWPIVESYVAGFFIPVLSDSGKDDFRFEYFWGDQILYTHSTFPQGYIYQGRPIGHLQGGAAQEFFFRYSHWFSPRNRLALEYIHGERGNVGRVTVNAVGEFDPAGILQAVERRNSWRVEWNLPLRGDIDFNALYGWERINNVDLRPGSDRTNQVFKVDISYRY